MFFSCPASLRVRVHPTSAFVNHSRHAHTFPQGTCFHNAYKNIRNAHTYRHVHSSLFQLGSREAAAVDFGSCSVKLTASKSRNTKRIKKHTKTKPNQHSNSNPTKFTERGEGEKLSLLNLRTIPVRFPLVKLQASGCNAEKEPRAHRERFGDFERLPHPVGHPTWTKRRVTDSRTSSRRRRQPLREEDSIKKNNTAQHSHPAMGQRAGKKKVLSRTNAHALRRAGKTRGESAQMSAGGNKRNGPIAEGVNYVYPSWSLLQAPAAVGLEI